MWPMQPFEGRWWGENLYLNCVVLPAYVALVVAWLAWDWFASVATGWPRRF